MQHEYGKNNRFKIGDVIEYYGQVGKVVDWDDFGGNKISRGRGTVPVLFDNTAEIAPVDLGNNIKILTNIVEG